MYSQQLFDDRGRVMDVYIYSAGDPDQERVCFIGSETLPSIYYILSDESHLL